MMPTIREGTRLAMYKWLCCYTLVICLYHSEYETSAHIGFKWAFSALERYSPTPLFTECLFRSLISHSGDRSLFLPLLDNFPMVTLLMKGEPGSQTEICLTLKPTLQRLNDTPGRPIYPRNLQFYMLSFKFLD